nr:aldo/keto reductase [Catenibacterium mitsuokai]
MLDYCRLNDITIQAWSIVQASWAEGTFLNHPDYKKLNNVLDDLAKKYNVTPATIATAWILRHPAHIQAITGTTSPKHLIETAEAANIELTRQEWYDLYLASDKPLP